MSFTDDIVTEQREGALREALRRALRQAEEAQAKTAELVDAVYRAVFDAASSWSVEPVTPPPSDHRKETEETAVILFSDLQLGQVTPSFNTQIAEQRVKRYAEKIIRLTELQRAHHPVRIAKLYLLGDLIEGEMIFPAQPHQIDSSLYAQVAVNGPRILTDFIRTLLTCFEQVEVVSVPGNHGDVGGASRKSYNPETNFDRMLTKIVEHILLEEDRVSFFIPDGYGESSFYAVDHVGNVGFLLWHGHQARRMSNSSHLSFYKLVQGWRAGAIPQPFSVSVCGHHHTPTFLSMGAVSHFINGTFASDAGYAIERLAANGRAAQWLLFARGDRGITAQYLVDLAD